MKITQINAYSDDGKVTVALNVESDLPIAEALSSVLALFAGSAPVVMKNVIDELPNDRPRDPQVDEAVAAASAPKTTRTRRPRTNPDATREQEEAKAVESVMINSAEEALAQIHSTTERRRTRVTAEQAPLEIKVITDADLAKACSNAAAIVGIEVVQAVIKDFAVSSMQELAPDVREKFLGELEDEIKLAKEELAAAGK